MPVRHLFTHRESHPTPAEILLLVEVSDATLELLDAELIEAVAYRPGVHARVHVKSSGLSSDRGPGHADRRSRGTSRTVIQARRGERLGVQALPGVVVHVAEVLGPAG